MKRLKRILRIAYGSCIVGMFNKIFSGFYNASLFGSQVVTVGNSIITESLERKSVGLPIGESTRAEIIETDSSNLHATGIKGAYFRLMSKLTGKKPISQKSQ